MYTRVRFSPVEEGLVKKYLMDNCGADQQKAEITASMSGGSIGYAKDILTDEDIYLLRDEVVERLMKILSPAYKNSFDFIKFLKSKKAGYKEVFSIIIQFLRDSVKISELNDENSISMKDKKEELLKFSKGLSKGSAFLMLETALKTQLSVEQNVNYSALMQMMVMDFWEVIHDRSNRC